jgi:predicted amidohydrolase
MQDLTVTLIQSDIIWKDVSANLLNYAQMIGTIKKKTDLIVLPEMFNTGFIVEPSGVDETMDGITMAWMKETARIKNCVITGSLIINENNQFFNRLIWMRPDGTYETYDKRHLFSFAKEHLKFQKGMKKLMMELKGWRINPLICYDLRFPVWSKNTLDEKGYAYDLLIYIANWPSQRGPAWRYLLPARAIENLACVIGVNRVGKDDYGNKYSGDSMIVAPDGEKLLKIEAGKKNISTYTLSATDLINFRNRFAFGLDWDHFNINR